MDMAVPTRADAPARAAFAAHWPIVVGVLAMGLPTLYSVASQAWSTDEGVHGPIVLATGTWLVWRRWGELRSVQRPGSGLLVGILLAIALVLYTLARAFDYLAVEAFAFGLALVTIFYHFLGGEALRRMWFPIFYLGFAIPIPGWLVVMVTGPLKTHISSTATWLLSNAGYPIVREGVTLYIAQYQLLVEDACAGLNSLISLTGISLFYIYILHNASWRYSVFLMLWIVPMAIVANLVRVIVLVLITYHFGNAAAQGFLHSTAGLVTFATALLGIFVIDHLMTPIRKRLIGRPAA